MNIVKNGIKYARFAVGLKRLVKTTTDLEKTKKVIAERMRNRDQNFLNKVKKGVYQYGKGPFFKLFRMAGCEYGDIESLVKKEGVDSTLEHIYKKGIYINWEEFKGKQDVVRGSTRFSCSDKDFDNPWMPVYYQVQSSGSRSAGTRTTLDLNHRTELSHYKLLELVNSNAFDFPVATWRPVPPAASGIGSMMSFWQARKPLDKWFSPVGEDAVKASLVHRAVLRYIVYCGRLWGGKFIFPEEVKMTEAVKIAKWLEDARKRTGGASLDCYASLAVMVCDAAVKNGLDIKGIHCFASGEPITENKRKRIEAAGAILNPKYNISEVGRIGLGCADGHETDEVHFMNDALAMIQKERPVPNGDMKVNSFFFTTLLPTAPKLLINTGFDDCGVVVQRDCGCLLGELGFKTHIHNIRSFSKLTGRGMTIMGSDLVKTLEETLPAKFGGSPTDYQLLEEEDESGKTTLSLIISPDIGEIDENSVIETILDDLRGRAYGGKLAAGLWSQMSILKIKRMYPLTKTGKILTLYLKK